MSNIRGAVKLATAVMAVVALGACAADSKPPPGISGAPVPSQSSSSSSSSSSASSGPATLKVIAVEPAQGAFVFDVGGTQSVATGPVDIAFKNAGTMTHELRLIRVRNGDFAAYKAALVTQGPTGVASLGDDAGGPGSVPAGQSRSTTVTLTPGTYALVCFLADANGKSFAQQGMIAELEVS